MTDGLPVVPPTKVKAEKFMGYSSYGYDDVIAVVDGRDVKAYMVAANAIMAGCSPEHLPVCIAFVQALGESEYLDSLRSGTLTPVLCVNGPAAHQIGIDDTQGMTAEEANFAIGRFMELALINLAGLDRTNPFGHIQPLVFAENDEACLQAGWMPLHVEEGFALEDTVITAASFSMWGNNVTIEEAVRDHLRGFARTIPSFLMAYGDDKTTLSTFDMIIPDDVSYEVTSITLDQFRFLRDGGSYTDAETGEEKRYPGKLFDPVVFDDSIKEFLSLRTRLGNYFDETHTEDIFDYIPPQKTNQIFTPKRIVKQMVDMLEQENSGCFDDPGKTFADLYMKSGLYIAEIVKRLFNRDGMKQAFSDETQRLQHIFEHQVYGLAPTEIIYQIALHFILGFDGGELIEKHHLRQCDALPLAKDGTLEAKLDSIFG